MKIKRIWISNYKAFRSTFDNDKEAKQNINKLNLEADKMLNEENNPHVDLFLFAAYDEEGDAIFELESLKILPDQTAILNVHYTGTVK